MNQPPPQAPEKPDGPCHTASTVNDDVPQKGVAHIVQRLTEKAATDIELAELLRALATYLLEQLPEPTVQSEASSMARGHEVNVPNHREDSAPQLDLASAEDLQALVTTFDRRNVLTVEPSMVAIGPYPSLETLPERLSLKARASRWVAEYGYTQDYSALAARKALIEEGKLWETYLWMLDISLVNPNLAQELSELAEAYELAAEMTAFWLAGAADNTTEYVQLLAFVQAGLREAVQAVYPPRGPVMFFDAEQKQLFEELKTYAQQAQRFLQGMSLHDRPGPDEMLSYREAFSALRRQLEQREDHLKTQKKTFSQLKYHVKKLAEGSHNPEHEWKRIADAVDNLLQSGLPASDAILRDALSPVLNLSWYELPYPTLLLVLINAQDVQASLEAHAALPDNLPEEESSQEVTALKALIRGKTIVFIGGDPRDGAKRRIEQGLACRVKWIPTKPHESLTKFEADIAKENVAAVLLLIRWASHIYAEIAPFCKAQGKPLVRIPGGYNVNIIAHEILKQASGKLSDIQSSS